MRVMSTSACTAVPRLPAVSSTPPTSSEYVVALREGSSARTCGPTSVTQRPESTTSNTDGQSLRKLGPAAGDALNTQKSGRNGSMARSPRDAGGRKRHPSPVSRAGVDPTGAAASAAAMLTSACACVGAGHTCARAPGACAAGPAVLSAPSRSTSGTASIWYANSDTHAAHAMATPVRATGVARIVAGARCGMQEPNAKRSVHASTKSG